MQCNLLAFDWLRNWPKAYHRVILPSCSSLNLLLSLFAPFFVLGSTFTCLPHPAFPKPSFRVRTRMRT